MQKLKDKKIVKQLAAVAMGACMLTTAGATFGGLNASAAVLDNGGKFYLDYSSYDEAKSAAEELNVKLSEEGSVLLKNDGTLPLTGRESVSVFGCIEDQLQNNTKVSDSVSTAFKKAGFNTNPALANFYKNHNRSDTVIHQEPLNFSQGVKNSFELYNDLAVIVVGRGGAEMNDLDTVIREEEKETYLGEDQGWEHEDLFYGSDNSYLQQEADAADDTVKKYKHKHELQLSDSEQALVKYVEEQNFKHIVFVINSSSAMETYNLEHDEKINAVIWIGRTGETGIHALPKIISGMITPSGKVSDEWYKDFTADPVWANFATLEHQFGFAATGVKYNDILAGGAEKTATQYPNNYMYADGTYTSDLIAPRYNGFNGTDYEEDIYIGYKYVESYYQDIYNGVQPIPAKYSSLSKEEAAKAWYEDTVTHPFGQGQSYTDFSMNIKGVYVNAAKTTTLAKALDDDVDGFGSAVGTTQKYKKLFVDVEVTNTGSVYSGKEVVQIYVNPPYTKGGIEKPAMRLVGFAKTKELKPGGKQTVTVEVSVQDMASYDDYDKNGNGFTGYELEKGLYTLYASNSSHVDLSTIETVNDDAQDKYEFNLSKDIKQQLDDFSDNKIENKFTDTALGIKNTQYNSLRNDKLNGSSYKVNTKDTAAMTQLSRNEGFAATFPQAPTKDDLTLSNTFVQDVLKSARYDADMIIDEDGTSLFEEEEWAVTEIPADWTQASTANEGLNTYVLSDIAGIDPESDAKITSGKFKDKTGKEAWTLFMNQLTWDELKQLVEDCSFQTPAIPSIDKDKGSDQDRPNMLSGTHNWCDEVVIASTFNTELARQEGIITANMGILYGHSGWYGPGMNIHRSAFSGRNNDYYSQDGIHAGLMAAEVVQGAQSRGLMCFIKHFAFNDEDVTRNGWVHFVWASEQALRENGAQAFQKAMQEGGALGAMSGFARIAGEACNINYRLLTGLARDEWDYKGTFITDAEPGSKATAATDLMIRAGNDMMLRNNHVQDAYNRWEVSGSWDATKRDGQGSVVVGEKDLKHPYAEHKVFGSDDPIKKTSVDKKVESVNQYYYTRMSAQRVLYITANSNMSRNGVSWNGWNGGELTATRGVTPTGSVAIANGNLGGSKDVKYTVVSGKLPEGLTMDASGSLTGAATDKAGEYQFTVECVVDGWVKKQAQYTVKVAEAFTLEADGGAKVGTDFYATVEQSVINKDNGYDDEITYTLTDGALPEGLTLDATGAISGKPLQAGTFEFTVNVKATKTTSGRIPVITPYNFQTKFSLTVVGADAVIPQYKVTFNTDGGSAVAQQTVNEGAKITAPAAPTKEGFVFDGWFYDADCKLVADVNNAVDGDITLYAGWTAAATEPEEKTGCSGNVADGAIIFGAVAALAVGAGVIIGRKKKKTDN